MLSSVANTAMYFEYISEKGVKIPQVCISAQPKSNNIWISLV